MYKERRWIFQPKTKKIILNEAPPTRSEPVLPSGVFKTVLMEDGEVQFESLPETSVIVDTKLFRNCQQILAQFLFFSEGIRPGKFDRAQVEEALASYFKKVMELFETHQTKAYNTGKGMIFSIHPELSSKNEGLSISFSTFSEHGSFESLEINQWTRDGNHYDSTRVKVITKYIFRIPNGAIVEKYVSRHEQDGIFISSSSTKSIHATNIDEDLFKCELLERSQTPEGKVEQMIYQIDPEWRYKYLNDRMIERIEPF